MVWKAPTVEGVLDGSMDPTGVVLKPRVVEVRELGDGFRGTHYAVFPTFVTLAVCVRSRDSFDDRYMRDGCFLLRSPSLLRLGRIGHRPPANIERLVGGALREFSRDSSA